MQRSERGVRTFKQNPPGGKENSEPHLQGERNELRRRAVMLGTPCAAQRSDSRFRHSNTEQNLKASTGKTPPSLWKHKRKTTSKSWAIGNDPFLFSNGSIRVGTLYLLTSRTYKKPLSFNSHRSSAISDHPQRC